jgi:glycosyltransferase involved in cell wall biosynthesis
MTRRVLVLGLDHVSDKALYYARELARHGIECHFISFDKTGLSRSFLERHGCAGRIASKNIFRHFVEVVRDIRRLRPDHIELFLAVRPWTLLFYVLVCSLSRLPLLAWCRGSEILNWERHHPVRRWVNGLALRRSRVVLLRELYMRDIIERFRVFDLSRSVFFPNSISMERLTTDETRIGTEVLFLNTLKPWRNPHLIVEAAAIVAAAVPDARFRVVGSTAHLESYSPAPKSLEERFIASIHEAGLEDRFGVFPFTDETTPHWSASAIFLLPADIVFCNFALLEAMREGLVPIVADVEGSDLIVEDGVSGFIVPRDAAAIAEKIRLLLADPDLRARMSQSARERVRRDYDTAERAIELVRLYETRLWSDDTSSPGEKRAASFSQ